MLIVTHRRTPNVPGSLARCPYQIADREGIIHQRGVSGDGEGGGSGEEEKRSLLIQNHISLEVTNER